MRISGDVKIFVVRIRFWGYNENEEMEYLEYKKVFVGRSGGYGDN